VTTNKFRLKNVPFWHVHVTVSKTEMTGNRKSWLSSKEHYVQQQSNFMRRPLMMVLGA